MTPEQRTFILSLDRDGSLAPDDVLAAATPEDSPIHGLFEWDDGKAGHAFRLDQARIVIRRVRVHYIESEPKVREIRVSEYIHDPELPHGQQGYVRTGLLKTQAESALAALQAELNRVASMIERTRMVAAKLGLEAECEAGLRDILGSNMVRKAG